MPVGIVTGSGAHALPGFVCSEVVTVQTEHGAAEVSRGLLGGAQALHVSRHGPGHARLSNHVAHRANIRALQRLGASAVLAATVCGAVDPTLELGSLVVFDDLHFPSNRLPDGSLCTFFTEPGDPERAHWVLHGGPFSPGARAALLAGAAGSGRPVRDGGVYGHVDGPRFNTPSEIAALAACGVVAVSQTAGPEAVLCGELGLPYGLVGFITDHANGVAPAQPTPVSTLSRLIAESGGVLAGVLALAAARVAGESPAPTGTVLRMGVGE
ncbi:MAG TPA: phosphorylase [Solirubrobacteraceae bacterium]|nr:phosphorylase [Solirubrobacteraceae bacterium]